MSQLTRAQLQDLASSNPGALISAVESGRLNPIQLTFAAEMVGQVTPSKSAFDALAVAAAHPRAIVREGALYGYAAHLPDPRSRNAIRAMAGSDEDGLLREMAAEYLEGGA